MKVALALAFALALITGWHALAGQWLPGDEALVLEHPLVGGPPAKGLPPGLFYRPVRTASLALDHAIWESNPAGYHLSNLAYHAASGVLVYALARQLALEQRAALVACALWVVHPAHTDAVAPIAGRREVLVALFYLAALSAYLAWRAHRSPLAALGVLVASVLAAYTKEMAITVPAVAAAIELALAAPEDRARRRFLVVWALVMGALIAHSTALGPGRASLPQRPLSAPLVATAARAFARYLYLAVWPVHLSSDYSYAAFPLSRSLTEPAALCGLTAALLYAALWAYWLKRRPAGALALSAFAIPLAPALALVATPEMLAEHTLHVPLVAFAIGSAGLAAPALERWPRRAALVAGLFIALYGARAHARYREWRDWPTLVAATVRDEPACARARSNLGLVLESAGRYAEAEREYRIALALEPDDAATLSNLGSLLMQRGAFAPARDALARAVLLQPGLVEAQNNLGAVLSELSDLAGAEAAFRRAIAQAPDHVAALQNLGMVLRRAGPARAAEAEQVYRRAIALDPENASAYNNLGALYLDSGRGPEAVTAFQRAVLLQPGLARGIVNLARALASTGQARAAEEALIRASSTGERVGTVQQECARLALDWKLPRLARAFLAKAEAAGNPDPELSARLKDK